MNFIRLVSQILATVVLTLLLCGEHPGVKAIVRQGIPEDVLDLGGDLAIPRHAVGEEAPEQGFFGTIKKYVSGFKDGVEEFVSDFRDDVRSLREDRRRVTEQKAAWRNLHDALHGKPALPMSTFEDFDKATQRVESALESLLNELRNRRTRHWEAIDGDQEVSVLERELGELNLKAESGRVGSVLERNFGARARLEWNLWHLHMESTKMNEIREHFKLLESSLAVVKPELKERLVRVIEQYKHLLSLAKETQDDLEAERSAHLNRYVVS